MIRKFYDALQEKATTQKVKKLKNDLNWRLIIPNITALTLINDLSAKGSNRFSVSDIVKILCPPDFSDFCKLYEIS